MESPGGKHKLSGCRNQQNDNLIYQNGKQPCAVITNGVMIYLRIEYNSQKWRLFIGASKLKLERNFALHWKLTAVCSCSHSVHVHMKVV